MILGALVLSVISNCALGFLLWRLKRSPKHNIDAKALIHDLTRRGSAVIRIECLDLDGLMYRRPQL